MKNVIEAQNIHKIFHGKHVSSSVLKGISLTIEENQFVGIMGKSGAGKSTLLYQLSALDRPTEGTILLNGVDVLSLSPQELVSFRLNTLGYVFQDYALIPELSVEENVMLPLLMRGDSWKDALEATENTLDSVGLMGKHKNYITRLSGGEQQRVAIARAVVGKPTIIFADEPTANLDSTSGREIINLLGSLHKEGHTIVMITHEAEYTDRCDRLIIVEDGVIISDESRVKNTVDPIERADSNPCYVALDRLGVAQGQTENHV